MTTTNSPAKPLGVYALEQAIKAVRNDDSAAFTATVTLSLVMANRQVERAESDKDITEKANKSTFRHFLKSYAIKGLPVWRDTDHMVQGFMALKGKDREKAVSEYVDGGKHATTDYKKPEGARLVEGLAKLRTWSFRLMSDVCTNHADVIRDLLVKKTAGASGEALAGHFIEFVKATYGNSFAKLTDRLAPAKTEKEKADPIDAIVKKAGDLTDLELQTLIAKIQGLWIERQATAADVAEMFGDTPDETEGEEVAEAA